MAFKHFRRHQKLYLILGLGAMIFSLVTFSVGSTISALARGEATSDVGTFVDSEGNTMTITREDTMRARLAGNESFAPFYKTEQKDAVIEHIILTHEARLAGIHVSDDMLAQAMTEAGLAISEKQYRDFVSRFGVTVSRFEEHFRGMVAIRLLRMMRQDGDLITSREVYDRFAADNEVQNVAYVAFPFAKYADDVDPDKVTDDELRGFYETDMPAALKRKEFSTPERFRFEAAYLDFMGAELSGFEELLGDEDEPSEEEIKRYYDVNAQRYRTHEPSADDLGAGEGEPSGAESAEGTGGAPAVEGNEETQDNEGGEEAGGGDEKGSADPDQKDGLDDSDDSMETDLPGHGPFVGASPAGSNQETSPEDSSGTEGDQGEGSWRKMTLDEARELIRKDLLFKKLLEDFQREYNTKRAELQRQAAEENMPPENGSATEDQGAEEGADKDAKPDGESGEARSDDHPGGEDAAASEEAKAAALNAELREVFKGLAEKYHLTYAGYDQPITRDEITELDPIGDSNLQYMVAALKPNDIRVRAPLEEQRFGYVLRMSEQIAPEPKPLEDVRDALRDQYVVYVQQKKAEEQAKAFREKVESLARDQLADEIDRIRKGALDLAEQRIAAQGIEEEPAKQKMRDDVVAGEQGKIETLVESHLVEHVEDVATEMGLDVAHSEPFRKNFFFSAAYRRLEPGPRKYLGGFEAGLSRLDVSKLTDVLTDLEGKACYVAWVVDRRGPAPEEMGPGDRLRARSSVERTHFIARGLFARQKDPQALKRLELEYQLHLNKKQDGNG